MRHHLPRPSVGKAAALKKYANSLHFREQAKVFNSASTVDDIVVAGENALVSLHGGKPGEKLNCMRYQRYCEKLATNSFQIQPQNLPPTSAAARHHSLSVPASEAMERRKRIQVIVGLWIEGDGRPGTSADA